MPQFDPGSFGSQLFWLAILFTLLYVICWKGILPKIRQTMESRDQRVSGNLEEARKLKEEAEEVLKQYEAGLARARADAQKTLGDAQATINEATAKREKESAARMAAQAAEAQKRIDAVREQALAMVREVAADAVPAIVDRMIGQAADGGAVTQSVEAALKERA